MYLQKIEDRIALLRKKCIGLGIECSNEPDKEVNFFPLNRNVLRDLRVAAIMDRFTLDSYRPECELFEVTPDGWLSEIEAFLPDMLFIESAWEGKDKLWYRKIANGSPELYALATYCHQKKIPVVFWNKEDPVYTDTFMPAAQLADVVFTTDIDCISTYKANLHHDRVYHLHFAAQPALHNPIEKFARKDKFCFAGAYYHRYPKRTEVFDAFADVFIQGKGFDIYDRNYQNSRPEHAFPKKYDPYILGKLDSSEIDVAYKGYQYGVNMNSIDQSQTMFARRVFEMLASNTVTVGNYSRGVKNYFGDLTICTNDKSYLGDCLNKYCPDEMTLGKYKLAGLRKVLQEHLYEDRLNYIVEKVFGKTLKKALPPVVLIAFVNNEEEEQAVLCNYNRQNYRNKSLYLVGWNVQTPSNNEKSIFSSNTLLLAENISDDTFVGVISTKDYYGANYLTDLLLTLRYYDTDGIGKESFLSFDREAVSVYNDGCAYKKTATLALSRGVVKKAMFLTLNDIQQKGEELIEGDFFSSDIYNYCKGYVGESCSTVDDLFIADTGVLFSKIQCLAEKVVQPIATSAALELIGKDLVALAKLESTGKLKVNISSDGFCLSGSLDDGVHAYVYFNRLYPVEQYLYEKKLGILFRGTGELETIGACLFYDEKGQTVPAQFCNMNRHVQIIPPKGAKSFKLALRVKGTGKLILQNIQVGKQIGQNQPSVFLSKADTLVLTNAYPQEGNLYKNMFLHKRIKEYKRLGHLCDILRFNPYQNGEYYEFEGCNILCGQAAELNRILLSSNINNVLIHFVTPEMMEVVKSYKDRLKTYIWFHGADVLPWWRRAYNFTTHQEKESAQKQSEERMAFISELFQHAKEWNLHFIFVSQIFANEVFEDYKLELASTCYSIIHNVVDTQLFDYIPKPSEQRKKLLSIRPYANNNYANDITTKCILELSKRPFFYELEFYLIGNGELFDETLRPIRKFSNVKILKDFIVQSDIAKLYKEYGVFLVPTRYDTQGVSRDEAMSSGLVAVTNAVHAVPEFVDDDCGIVVPAEDYMAMADGIERLYNDPELFLRLSENAAKRVRGQTAPEFTIQKELNLIYGEQ
ncbi:MAG: glycosyltransferase [Christensenellaceae bacterium]